MKIIEKDSYFTIYGDFTLSSTDQEVLSFLYLPIIKSDAFSLYETLYSLSLSQISKEYFYHSQTISMMGLDDTRFLDARNRLEAIGLLETYRKEDKDRNNCVTVSYLYKILPPATPKKFFDDPILRTTLNSFVDGKQYARLKSKFLINPNTNFDTYKNISTQFSDVFSINVDENDVSIQDNGLLNLSKSYKKQSDFSFTNLSKLLKEQMYTRKFTKEEKTKIKDVACIYSLSEEEACDLILKNTTTDDVFVIDSFVKDVKTLKKYVPTQTVSTEENYNSNSENAKLIKVFNEISPKQLLSIYFNAEPSKFMINFLTEIKNNLNLSDAVINVALHFSLKNTNNEFNEKYIEKVLYSLSSNNISNCYDAMVFLSNRNFEAKKTKGVRRYKNDQKEKEEIKEEENIQEENLDDLAKDLGL